ncbi:MAG: spore coat protein [Clostridiales bacterium]|nr:spore coat protein [Clostridiales bacterium]
MPTKTKQSTTQKNTTSITNPRTRSNTGSSSRPKTTRNCNCSTEFAQDECKLSDKEIISDVLGSHKALIKLYGTALCETSCPKLRNLIDNQLSECAEDQFDAFLYMHERGLYPTDAAPMPKINQAKKKYCACEQFMKQ